MGELSLYLSEKEIIFLPFSAFEIKEIKSVTLNNERIYEIKLLYLGNFMKRKTNNI